MSTPKKAKTQPLSTVVNIWVMPEPGRELRQYQEALGTRDTLLVHSLSDPGHGCRILILRQSVSSKGPVTWGSHLCGRQEQQLGVTGLHDSKDPVRAVKIHVLIIILLQANNGEEIHSAGPEEKGKYLETLH